MGGKDEVITSIPVRKVPVKYPAKSLPQRTTAVRSVEHKKPETKPRQEVAKQKSGDTASKMKYEGSQKRDDTSGDEEDVTDVKKESDESIQEMFPEVVPEEERELDAITTRLLEYELRHIMIKVWQEFPDDPPTEEEKLVAEKFRNEAGDDIRNVIGLNVTKRLLNVHNRLIVKVRFSSRPEKSYLLAFLKKYKIRGFKRVISETNTFAAQLKTIEDFDRICAEKMISCGNAKLTITPCYTFMKCPPKLKTKFVDETDDDKSEDQEKCVAKDNKEESQKIEDKEKVSIEVKAADTKNEKAQAEKPTNVNPVKNDKKESEIAPKVENKQKIINKPDAPKQANIQTNKTTVQKSEVKNVSQTTTVAQTKENNFGKNNENNISETEVSMKPAAVKSKESITNVTKNSQSDKQTGTATKPVKAQVITNNTPTKIVPKPKTPQKMTKPATVVKNKVVKDIEKVQPKKIQSDKVIKRNNIKTAQKEIKKDVTKKYDDYDEMDDEDILALLSEGVVLDECGSDDE